MKSLYEPTNEAEAQEIATMLASHAIECEIVGHALDPFGALQRTSTTWGVLRVLEGEFDRARALLVDWQAQQFEQPGPDDPEAEDHDVRSDAARLAPRILVWALLTILPWALLALSVVANGWYWQRYSRFRPIWFKYDSGRVVQSFEYRRGENNPWRVTQVSRLGTTRTISIDNDADGWLESSATSSSRSTITTMYYDRDEDGIFDEYLVLSSSGNPLLRLLDTDRDGMFNIEDVYVGSRVSFSWLDQDQDGNFESALMYEGERSAYARLTDTDRDGFLDTVRCERDPPGLTSSVLPPCRPVTGN